MAERAPGFENYIPSRLEWLTVMLNSLEPDTDSIWSGKISRVYLPKHDGKTLVLMVNYSEDIDAEILEDCIKNMEEHAKTIASINKWDSWLEIEIKRNPKKQSPTLS